MAGASQQHIMERRSHLLAQRLKQRISDTALALQAGSGRIPYRTSLSKGDALDWWAEHRYDDLGKQALQGYSPLDVAKLDSALNQRVQEMQNQGLPVKTSPDISAPPPTGSVSNG